MSFYPVDPLILAALIGLSLAAAVDVATHGRLTYHTALWAILFLGGFYVNYHRRD
jgi:hypothetical protein